MSVRLKNKGFVPVLIIFWLGLGLFARFLHDPVIPPINRTDVDSEAVSTTPFAFISKGTFGLERSDGLHWMKESVIVYKIVNPLPVEVIVDGSLNITSNPCGEFVEFLGVRSIESGSVAVKLIKHTISYSVVVRANEDSEFEFDFKKIRCVTRFDPRVFVGAVQETPIFWEPTASK